MLASLRAVCLVPRNHHWNSAVPAARAGCQQPSAFPDASFPPLPVCRQVMDMELSRDGLYLTTAAGNHVTVFNAETLVVHAAHALETELECATLCPSNPNRVAVGGQDMWVRVLEVGHFGRHARRGAGRGVGAGLAWPHHFTGRAPVTSPPPPTPCHCLTTGGDRGGGVGAEGPPRPHPLCALLARRGAVGVGVRGAPWLAPTPRGALHTAGLHSGRVCGVRSPRHASGCERGVLHRLCA